MTTLTNLQNERAYGYVVDILENLPPKAVNELLGGYGGDIERLIQSLYEQTTKVLNFGTTVETGSLEYLSNLETCFDNRLKELSLNYFVSTMLGDSFNMGWRHLEWGNLVQLFPQSAYLASRGHGKSYYFSYALPLWRLWSYNKIIPGVQKQTIDNKNREETCIITNTETLGKLHISKIRETISNNDFIAEKLDGKNASLGETHIRTQTGSKLHLRGKDGFIRGLHVGGAIVDDLPDESSLYSQEQREKLRDLFYATIKPIVEPYGYLIVSGTPYHEADIYGSLKKDPNFKLFEYPAIAPDGRLLAPDRFSYDVLMQERESQGSILFTREYMVTPVSEDSTIFPYEFLNNSKQGMENISFVDNIGDFPFKLKRVVVGADFAKSANVGADYTVYTVWGVDTNETYYCLHVWRKQGASYEEQVNNLVSLNNRFKPNKIVCEDNGFQSILLDLLRAKGVKNVENFTTTSGIKKNWQDGLPSLSAFFERSQLKIPCKHGTSSDVCDLILSEFNSISFNPNNSKLESAGGHDDIVMSCFFALRTLIEKTTVFKAYQI